MAGTTPVPVARACHPQVNRPSGRGAVRSRCHSPHPHHGSCPRWRERHGCLGATIKAEGVYPLVVPIIVLHRHQIRQSTVTLYKSITEKPAPLRSPALSRDVSLQEAELLSEPPAELE